MDIEALKVMFTTVPAGVVAIGLFATFITVLTLRFGASLAIAFSIALVIGHTLFSALPDSFMLGSVLSGITSPVMAAGIYGGLVVLLTIVLYRMTATTSDESARPLFAIATGIATTVVMLTVWYMAPQLQSLWHFNEIIQGAFGSAYRVYWIFAAFVVFAFVKS